MANNIKTDNEVMRVLDLKEISRVICNTDKSYLTLKLRKGEDNYWLYLDSVPLNKEDNKELMGILFPIKEREMQQVNTHMALVDKETFKDIEKVISTPKKKGGRPKKTK